MTIETPSPRPLSEILLELQNLIQYVRRQLCEISNINERINFLEKEVQQVVSLSHKSCEEVIADAEALEAVKEIFGTDKE